MLRKNILTFVFLCLYGVLLTHCSKAEQHPKCKSVDDCLSDQVCMSVQNSKISVFFESRCYTKGKYPPCETQKNCTSDQDCKAPDDGDEQKQCVPKPPECKTYKDCQKNEVCLRGPNDSSDKHRCLPASLCDEVFKNFLCNNDNYRTQCVGKSSVKSCDFDQSSGCFYLQRRSCGKNFRCRDNGKADCVPTCLSASDCSSGEACHYSKGKNTALCTTPKASPTADARCTVTIKSATVTKEKRWELSGGPPDPFVVLEFSKDSTYTTNEQKNNYTPVWNQTTPSLPYYRIMQMKVILFDNDDWAEIATGLVTKSSSLAKLFKQQVIASWGPENGRWYLTGTGKFNLELNTNEATLKLSITCN